MDVFREVAEFYFGPNNREAWQQLSREIGAECVDLGVRRGCRVEARFSVWTITLDTYVVGKWDDRTIYTRIRAPYVNADGFWFKIYRTSLLSDLDKYFGMQSVEIGDPEFDLGFITQGNDPNKLAYLFRSPRIRDLLTAQVRSTFEVRDGETAFGEQSPEGVDGLYYDESGVITDVERLKQLFALFAETLTHLCHMGSAYEQDPELTPGS